jgi:hypothetical protein
MSTRCPVIRLPGINGPVLAATPNVVAPGAVGSPANTHSVLLGQATVSGLSCRLFVIADHRTAGAPAGARGTGVVGAGGNVNEIVPSNAAPDRPWAHAPRSVDTFWVLVMVSEVPPALANEPLSTLPR